MTNKKQALIKTNKKDFFKYWLLFTKPLHQLKGPEISVLSLLLFYYFELKEKVSDDDLVYKLLFDYDTKMKIKNELNYLDQTLQNSLTLLRKLNVIKDNKISPSFIPDINNNSNEFTLTYKFNINGN